MSAKDIEQSVWKQAGFGELEGLKALVEVILFITLLLFIYECLILLIIYMQAGKDVNVQDERGFTPICWAARNGHMNIIIYLIELKVSLELPSFGGLTPLHHACNKNQEKIVSKLIKAGCNINCADDNGDTPLQFASSRGVLNIVVELLENGATQIPNGQGVYPIHKAALFGQLAIVKRLFEKGGDINCTDSLGDTPLHYACKCNFQLVAKYLIDQGARIDVSNQAGNTPKQVAGPLCVPLFAQ